MRCACSLATQIIAFYSYLKRQVLILGKRNAGGNACK